MVVLRSLRAVSLGALATGLAVTACSSDDPETAPPATATSAPPTTTAAGEPATSARIVAAGDSLMYDTAPALAAALDPATSDVVSMVVPSLHAASARSTLYEAVRAEPTDVVVVMVGVWESGFETEAGADITEPGWGDGYRREVLDPLVGELAGAGAHLLLVAEPPMGAPDAQARFDTIAAVWEQLAQDRPEDASFADSATWLGGGDEYLEVATLPDGSTRRLRRTDRVHLCGEGAARIALGLIDEIDAVVDPRWEPAVVDGWEDGPWTDRFPADECPPVEPGP